MSEFEDESDQTGGGLGINSVSTDCSFAKDKSVIKIVRIHGMSLDMPTDAAKVTLRVKSINHGSQEWLKEPKVLEFIVGNGDVCDALEMAAVHMKVAEESVVIVTRPEICEEPLLGFVFPEGQTSIGLDLEMVDFKNVTDPFLMDENEKIAYADARKAIGAELIKRNRVALASNLYKHLAGLFGYYEQYEEANKKKVEELTRACQLNKAMCQLKLEQFHDAKISCNEVLEKDDTNIKAQYRLASAEFGLKNFCNALAVLKQLLEANPQNVDARRLLKEVQTSRKEEKKKTDGIFAKMSSNLGKGPMRDAGKPRYRFEVGTRVECKVGGPGWSAGKIIKLDYSEPDWPPEKIAPYQVELDDGRKIYVPSDIPQLCRLYAPPWWSGCFVGPASNYATNPSADGLHKIKGRDKDVNQTDPDGVGALHQAVAFNWPVGVLELLKMAADVNIADKEMVHPLHIAVQIGKPEIMAILLEGKADPNCRDKNPDYDPEFTSVTFGDRLEHRTPLHYCSAEGFQEQVAMVPMLIQAKADLDTPDAEGKTPLQVGIEENKTNIVDALLQSKADVNLGSLLSSVQKSPLMYAAHENKTDLASSLILARADVNKQGKQGLGALHLAARRGKTKMVKMLMEARADTSQKSDLGTPWELAKKNGGHDLIALFGVEANSKTVGNITSIAELDAEQRKALFLDD